MRRRSWLIALAGGIGAVAASTTWLPRWLSGGRGGAPEPESPLARALRAHFPYLQLEPEVLAAFERDYRAAYGAWRGGDDASPYMRFLASTDFFQTGADESRSPRYVALYDPYRSPCYNPFSG